MFCCLLISLYNRVLYRISFFQADLAIPEVQVTPAVVAPTADSEEKQENARRSRKRVAAVDVGQSTAEDEIGTTRQLRKRTQVAKAEGVPQTPVRHSQRKVTPKSVPKKHTAGTDSAAAASSATGVFLCR